MSLGCAALRPAATPLRTVDLLRSAPPAPRNEPGGDGSDRSDFSQGGRCLAVLLPGRLDEPEQFERAGFARAVASRGLAIDLVAVDSHLGYYRARSVVERLRTDVIVPARAAGYDTIWIVGTSLGGLGGLLYLRDHPEDLAGVLALAPYLGDTAVIEEIERAGGPGRWQAPPTVAGSDVGRELWSWLATWPGDGSPVPLHLGWGAADDFARSNGLLAGLLPPQQVYTVAGGHDWRVWERLWEEFLDRNPLCAARP